jgi:hypothetical protein
MSAPTSPHTATAQEAAILIEAYRRLFEIAARPDAPPAHTTPREGRDGR